MANDADTGRKLLSIIVGSIAASGLVSARALRRAMHELADDDDVWAVLSNPHLEPAAVALAQALVEDGAPKPERDN